MKISFPFFKNTPGDKHQTRMIDSASSSNRQQTLQLPPDTVRCITTDRSGISNLHWAAWTGDAKRVAEILQIHPNFGSSKDFLGRTVLHYAVQENRKSVVETVVGQSGVEVDLTGHFGRTPLHWAAEKGLPRIMLLLLKSGAAVDAQDLFRQTALSRAAWRGWQECVSLLLGQEARSDIPDLHGQMPLYLAAANGRIQVVSQLSKRQGLTATDDLKTCLYLAAKCGHRGAACILMKELVFTNANGNNDFKTLEQIDGWQNDFTDIGRDVDLLVWAALNGIESMSNRFIGNGVKIQSYSLICNMTAMQAAAGSGHIEIVDLLLRKGAQVNAAATSINDRTALQAAAGGGHFDIVEMLNAAIA